MRKVDVTLNTNGCGYWSEVAKPVKIVGINMPYVSDDEDFGELKVFFDTKTWDIDTDGLIYTDRQFEAELKAFLTAIGLVGEDITYSEQGMQGNDYVSFDIGEDFIKSYDADPAVANVLA